MPFRAKNVAVIARRSRRSLVRERPGLVATTTVPADQDARRIDALSADIANLDTKIEAQIALADAVARLKTSPGSVPLRQRRSSLRSGSTLPDPPSAPGLLGPVRSRCQGVRRPQEGHRIQRSRRPLPGLGPRRGRRLRRQDQHPLGRTLPAHRPRRGKKKAIVGVGRSILVIVWHLLSDDTTRFQDLGPRLLRLPHQPRT